MFKTVAVMACTAAAGLGGCAPAVRQFHPPASAGAAPTDALDSARTLIRRGMTAQGRAVLDALPPDTAALRLVAWSLEKDRDWQAAADLWRELEETYPNAPEFTVRRWRALVELAKTLAETQPDRAQSLRDAVASEGNALAEASDYASLVRSYFAAALLNDASAQSRADRLLESFPDSQVCVDLVGDRLWDGLYPIWNQNEPRIEFLSQFVERYKNFSWRDTAWRMMVGIYAGMGDREAMMREASRWAAASSDDPAVLHSCVAFALDYDGDLDSARAWAQRAYDRRDHLSQPRHLPDEEWLLYGPQIRAGLPLRLAEVRLREGRLEEAYRLASESLALADYGVDEYATPAPQHELLGRIASAMKNHDLAARHWIDALTAGDERNQSGARADSALRAVFGLDSEGEVLDFCRGRRNWQSLVFTRVTEFAGLGGAQGSRIAWGDFDGDGDDDLLCGGTRLFRNDGGNFADVTDSVGLAAPGCHGGVWADYDHDGDLDLLTFSSALEFEKAERLFRNRLSETGQAVLIDVTGTSGDIQDNYTTEAALWTDFNGDGRLDLYVPGYEHQFGGPAWPDRALIQDDSGRFRERARDLGLAPPDGIDRCGRSPAACDFDRDGDLDLYVGNYRLQPNQFYVNRTRGSSGDDPSAAPFADRAAWYMVDGEEVDNWFGHTIGCQWGDFDGDGDFDLVVGNLAHPRYIRFSNRTMLYRNDGPDRPFTDVRRSWGIKYDECHSEPLWADFDNDGDLDLYITSVYPDRRSYLYRNDGTRFTDVTFLSGTRVFNGWGCAAADYDNDGDLDLAVCTGGKVELFRNDTHGGPWIEIALDGRDQPTLSRCGFVVELSAQAADGSRRTQVRQFEWGKGAGSQSSLTVHFGLGDMKAVALVCRDPGRRDFALRLAHPQMNRRYRTSDFTAAGSGG